MKTGDNRRFSAVFCIRRGVPRLRPRVAYFICPSAFAWLWLTPGYAKGQIVSDCICDEYRPVVVKIGGSILLNAKAHRRVALFLQRRCQNARYERFVVVVSAQNGATDALERMARRIVRTPGTRALDLLWATGELRSVALLTLHLQALGISSVGLDVHETGLRLAHMIGSPSDVVCQTAELLGAMEKHSVVVVPGFLATSANGAIVSLGRGGSDLTAVRLAQCLGASRCELVKDVPGYFTRDPNRDSSAEHIPWLSYEQALTMAEAGCKLVQQQAIVVALRADLALVVRSLDDGKPVSVVSSPLQASGAEPANEPMVLEA